MHKKTSNRTKYWQQKEANKNINTSHVGFFSTQYQLKSNWSIPIKTPAGSHCVCIQPRPLYMLLGKHPLVSLTFRATNTWNYILYFKFWKSKRLLKIALEVAKTAFNFSSEPKHVALIMSQKAQKLLYSLLINFWALQEKKTLLYISKIIN